MRFKRLLALLAAAALALSLLAGCGNGSKAMSDVIADLLSGLYDNVAVEVDPDLTAALKKAAAEGGTEEEILARMIEILNLNNVSITFTRLGSGQQGDHAVTLYFQTGTDPDAASRNALAQWASTLGTLPDDGSFQGDVAMIEAENGYYIALNVEVLKAGTPDKSDQSDADDDNHLGYTENGANSYTVSTAQGFNDLVTLKQGDIAFTSITLDCDVTLPENWPDGLVYTASFDGGNHTVSGVSGNGMFDEVTSDASVKNVKFADVKVSGNGRCGTVAATNNGTIDNCHVLLGSVSGGNSTGGLVGYNAGSISNSSAACSVEGDSWVGGIAGENTSNAIMNCEVSGTVEGGGWTVGGIVGYSNGEVTDCTVSGNVICTGTIEDSTESQRSGCFVGGIVGFNDDAITNCRMEGKVSGAGAQIGGITGYNWGQVTCSSFTGTEVTGSWQVGGIVGFNESVVKACYAEGNVHGSGLNGVVGGVVGTNNGGTVTACYAKGSVSTAASNMGEVGGVVGQNYMYMHSAGAVSGCYFSGSLTAPKNVGGVVGHNTFGCSVTGCYAVVQSINCGDASQGGVIGANLSENVQACYWYGVAASGIGTGYLDPSSLGYAKIGATVQDVEVTWESATDAMNQASGVEDGLKFVYSSGIPTLPLK